MILNKKKIVRAIILFLLIIVFVTLNAAPEISFNFLTHDFGEIKEEDGKVSFDFTFTNTGDDTLTVTKVKAS